MNLSSAVSWNLPKIGKQLRVSEEQLTQYLNRSSSGNSGSGQDIPYTSVNFEPESSLLKRDYLLHSSGIILGGQTSAALELLLGKMSAHPDGLPVLQSHMNDYNGLYSCISKRHISLLPVWM